MAVKERKFLEEDMRKLDNLSKPEIPKLLTVNHENDQRGEPNDEDANHMR
jgi:hypothetical protein